MKPIEKILIALSIFLVAFYYIFVSFLSTRPSNETGSYTETAYAILTQGKFIAPSSRGILDMDKLTYWILPLHSFFQVPFYILLGFGMWQITLIQIVILILSMLVVKKFANFLTISAIVPIVLLLTNRNFLVDSLASRPDTLGVLFGTLSILAVMMLQKYDKKILIFITGISLGLSILSYQLSVIYALSIALFLIWQKKFKQLFQITLISVVIVIPYLFYILISPQTFLLQMSGIYKTVEFTDVFEILKTEFWRYVDFAFYAPAFALLFLYSLYKSLKERKKETLFISLTIIIFLLSFAIMTHKLSFQMIFVMPLMAILIGYYVKDYRIITLAIIINFAVAMVNIAMNLPTQNNPSFLSMSDEILQKTDDMVLTYATFFPTLKERTFSYEGLRYAYLLGMNISKIVEDVKPAYIILPWDDGFKDKILTNYQLNFTIKRIQPSILFGNIDRSLEVYKRS